MENATAVSHAGATAEASKNLKGFSGRMAERVDVSRSQIGPNSNFDGTNREKEAVAAGEILGGQAEAIDYAVL